MLLPYLTAMINASLREGHLPETQKHAILTPLVKKPYFDVRDLKNYRPVSNLAFISKVVERIVAQKLVSYLQEHDLLPRLQSALIGAAPSLDGDCASAYSVRHLRRRRP